MARADLLLNIVKAARTGDQTLFRKTVEAMIAEERAKNHNVLADRLADQLQAPSQQNNKAPILNGERAASLYHEITPRKGMSDLILPDIVQDACKQLVEEHHRSDLLRSHNLEPRNKVLLVGPPGNGKTSLAEALAEALMVPFIVVRYEGIIGSYLGETASRLQRLFDYVRTRQCVLFFDEFDTIGKERGDLHETGEIKRVVSSLLLQIDDLPSHVVAITATNHPELLDRAVWRRFQIRLQLPHPGPKALADWFKLFTSKLDLDLGFAPKTLADKLKGSSFSEAEDFTTDIVRRYVLGQPEVDIKKIVNEQVKQWRGRIKVNATAKSK
jgi:SpoVK/Ycf46/Vps4 family AAA+-type ATPase